MVGCWRCYLSGARCRLAYAPADATVSCFSKIQIGFAFLVPAHPGSPGERAVKRVCVLVHCCYKFCWNWRVNVVSKNQRLWLQCIHFCRLNSGHIRMLLFLSSILFCTIIIQLKFAIVTVSVSKLFVPH